METKLHEFQFKTIHCYLATTKLLKKIGLANSDVRRLYRREA